MAAVREAIEWIVLVIELLGVFVVAASVAVGLVYPRLPRERADVIARYRQRMGRGLLLGLELLLAADIIDTVGMPLTIENLLPLGLLAVIRSFLSWSLEVEIEGCWPWRTREREAAEPGGAGSQRR